MLRQTGRSSRWILAALWAIPVAVAAQERVRIHAGQLLDGKGGVSREATIVVENGRIAAVEPGGGKKDGSGPVYELSGLTVLPGLIDVHAHVYWHFNSQGRLHIDDDGETPAQGALSAAANAFATLAAGFTTVQSPGSAEDLALREAIAAGGLPGPRLLTAL